jgi:hypothetical protein
VKVKGGRRLDRVGAGTLYIMLEVVTYAGLHLGGFGLEAPMAGLARTSTVAGLLLPNTQNTQNWLH